MSTALEHAAVYVRDLEQAKDYYVRFFSGTSGPLYRNSEGFSSYFISFGGGARLELMNSVHVEFRAASEFRSGWSHVALSVGSKEAVLETTRRITQAGYPLYSAPRSTGDGYFESCVGDPDGNRVEITL